jgi:hypothetical protein
LKKTCANFTHWNNHFYESKTSIVGKVVSERLLKKEGLVEKLTGESQRLKRELNKAQASSLDLE